MHSRCYCFFKYDGDAGFLLIWKARSHALTHFIHRHRLQTLFSLSPNPSGCETAACQLLHSRRAPSGGGHMQQQFSYVGQATHHHGSSFGLCCMMCCFFCDVGEGMRSRHNQSASADDEPLSERAAHRTHGWQEGGAVAMVHPRVPPSFWTY